MSFAAWLGRTEVIEDVVASRQLTRLAALLDYNRPPWPQGETPPLGHWLSFLPIARQSELGEDGHLRRGDFLPPIELPRRMWAGGALEFHSPIAPDAMLQRRSIIKAINEKYGASGRMVFVTIEHEVRVDGALAVVEQQDIVYRGEGRGTSSGSEAVTGAVVREVVPDEAMLFRFSALTFNGHRIHYDHRYATEVENYPNLVVQGPLTATLLIDAWLRRKAGARVRSFTFRARQPLFVNEPIQLRLEDRDGEVFAQAVNPRGEVAMDARILPA